MTGSEFAGAAVAHDVPLAPLTTLRVGPRASTLITCTSTEQVAVTLAALRDRETPALVLGGGSNVVIADGLADLTVVRLANSRIALDGNRITAEAGARWDAVVATATDAGLGGLECLSGIPGSAGATPVQNVGAYGAEVADTLTRVHLLDRVTGELGWVAAAELGLGYRTSVLKHAAGPAPIVVEVEFILERSGVAAPPRYGELSAALGARSVTPADVRSAVLALRRRKGMVLDAADHDTWSMGSFFTNPVIGAGEFERLQVRHGSMPHYPAGDRVKLAAGWLVEQAGFARGFPGEGAPARLSTKHALALTNRGGAGSADIIALARRVRDGVAEVFGIELIPEPVLVGLAI